MCHLKKEEKRKGEIITVLVITRTNDDNPVEGPLRVASPRGRGHGPPALSADNKHASWAGRGTAQTASLLQGLERRAQKNYWPLEYESGGFLTAGQNVISPRDATVNVSERLLVPRLRDCDAL